MTFALVAVGKVPGLLRIAVDEVEAVRCLLLERDAVGLDDHRNGVDDTGREFRARRNGHRGRSPGGIGLAHGEGAVVGERNQRLGIEFVGGAVGRVVAFKVGGVDRSPGRERTLVGAGEAERQRGGVLLTGRGDRHDRLIAGLIQQVAVRLVNGLVGSFVDRLSGLDLLGARNSQQRTGHKGGSCKRADSEISEVHDRFNLLVRLEIIRGARHSPTSAYPRRSDSCRCRLRR